MERYYDAHLYLANWGTRQVMLRLPRSVLDLAVAEQYCVGEQVTAWTAGEFMVLDLTSEDDSDDWDYEPEGSLSAIVGVRAELTAGDLRPLYLAWLAGYGTWERDELMRLAQEIPDDQVPDALREMRRHLQPVSARPWPPAFFASSPGDGASIAEQADHLLRQGFGR